MSVIDQELKVMSAIQKALFSLPQGKRERVLGWIDAKKSEGAWNDPPVSPAVPKVAPAGATASAQPQAARAN